MRDTIAETTDSMEPVDLDAGLTEFERDWLDDHPKVSPKSPYGRISERQYSERTFFENDEVLSTLYPDVEVPVWHTPDADYTWKFPAHWAFVSEEYSVNLRREPGTLRHGGLAAAQYIVRLAQQVKDRDPMIECWLKADGPSEEDGETVRGRVSHSLVRLDLKEAVEVANLLLLLVDVARDPAGQGGE
ncbi:hypothetical protein HQ308_16905 [Rhodococcus sp. BP-241]|uniref:hypothetical protein n=1 Tax=Rhodococcus sp. BP-241 TaxID=2739441 RepID=UPI001C9A942F|nr:hypothetical protein [Rhodococcus sp. BP-241]MBY6708482.1 hypothetical protein [Rhodococcus sp. BP-241]